ncbi:17282_t:CDS:1, partial [Cetraspora pellucida]
MELFYFQSGGPYAINQRKRHGIVSFSQSGGTYAINQANKKLKENLYSTKHLITVWKFISFLPRPKNRYYERKNLEEYPEKDGYKNYRQLNIST